MLARCMKSEATKHVKLSFIRSSQGNHFFTFANHSWVNRSCIWWLQNCWSVRWLNTVFQDQDLPSLSINYVAISKDWEKLRLHAENLLWSGLQRHRSCHSNELTLLAILLAAVFLGTENCSSKIVRGSFFLLYRPRCSRSLSGICKSVIEIFWDTFFMVRNTVKNGQSGCFAVICRNRIAFDMQFHLIVVSICLKTCVKDHGDSSSRLLERRVW